MKTAYLASNLLYFNIHLYPQLVQGLLTAYQQGVDNFVDYPLYPQLVKFL
jgi:hypothetical protein